MTRRWQLAGGVGTLILLGLLVSGTPTGLLFTGRAPVADQAVVLKELAGGSPWVLVEVPLDFPGSAIDYLDRFGLRIEEGGDGQRTNWFVLDDGTCGPSRAMADGMPPRGVPFWFATGHPAPDRGPQRVPPPPCA
jgi:hypothetical protein